MNWRIVAEDSPPSQFYRAEVNSADRIVLPARICRRFGICLEDDAVIEVTVNPAPIQAVDIGIRVR